MTALTAEADSFSGRVGGLTRAQPGPGVDVARPVHVGVHRAVRGADHLVLPGAGAPGATAVAADAGAGRVHPDHKPASFFRFASKDSGELGPARVQHRLVQPGLGRGPSKSCWSGSRVDLERSMVLTGLRGVGKTVLLNSFRSMAMQRLWGTGKLEARPDQSIRRPIAGALHMAVRELAPRHRAPDRIDHFLGVLKAFAARDTRASKGPVMSHLGIDAPAVRGRAARRSRSRPHRAAY